MNVNNAVTASLNVSPDDVRYNQAGEKIGTGTPTVTWSAANADSVSIDPLGSVGTNGSQPLQVTPPSGAGHPNRYLHAARQQCLRRICDAYRQLAS